MLGLNFFFSDLELVSRLCLFSLNVVWKVLWSSKLPFWFLKKISKLTLICQASSTPTLPQNILPETPPAQYRESPHRTNGYWNISIPLIVHNKVSQSSVFGNISICYFEWDHMYIQGMVIYFEFPVKMNRS